MNKLHHENSGDVGGSGSDPCEGLFAGQDGNQVSKVVAEGMAPYPRQSHPLKPY